MTTFTMISNLKLTEKSLPQCLLYLLLPAIFIISFLYSAQNEMRYRFHRDYAEGTSLSYVEKWRSSDIGPQKIYSNDAFIRGDITGYPLLHIGILKYTSKDPATALFVGRALSLCALFFLILVAWNFLGLFQKESLWKFPFFCTLFIAQSALFDWALLARSDILAALFELLGIYAYFKEEKSDYKKYFVSGLCFLLAFFTKQNYIVGPLLIFIYECRFQVSNLKRLIPIYTGQLIVAILLITSIFGAGYWQHTVFQLQDSPLYASRLAGLTFSYFIPHLHYLALAAIFFAFYPSLGRYKFILGLYFGITITLALTGLGRIGSNFNYFINVSTPLAIMAFLTIEKLIRGKGVQKYLTAAVLVFFFAQLYIENHALESRYPYPFLMHRNWPPTQPNQIADIETTKEIIRLFEDGKVFCDDPGLCVIYGQLPQYYFFETQLSSTPEHKKQKVNALMEKIKNKHYSAMLLTDYPSEKLSWSRVKYSTDIIRSIEENYELALTYNLHYIFTPKK